MNLFETHLTKNDARIFADLNQKFLKESAILSERYDAIDRAYRHN